MGSLGQHYVVRKINGCVVEVIKTQRQGGETGEEKEFELKARKGKKHAGFQSKSKRYNSHYR